MNFSIGEMSRHTGVKVPTIRYYEQMALIEAPERSSGNQRRYGRKDLKRLFFIRHARDLGFSIEDIKSLLNLIAHPELSCGDVHKIASRHLEEIKNKMSKLECLERELELLTTCHADSRADCLVTELLSET